MTEHEKMRREFWINMCTSYVNAANSGSRESMIVRADNALREFDKRFDPVSEWDEVNGEWA